MKILRLILIISLFSSMAEAQTIEDVLSSVASHNKEMKAGEQQLQSQKLEVSTMNRLEDPMVEYGHLWGRNSEIKMDFSVTQEFDFPTVYFNRHKMMGLKSSLYDNQYAALRQQILLQAKEVCLDIISLNQKLELWDERQKIAEELSAFYTKRLQQGDANILETNKVKLELLNVKTQRRMLLSNLQNKLRELRTLNGDEDISFTSSAYPAVEFPRNFDELFARVLENDPEMKLLKGEQYLADRQLSLSKSQWWPKLAAGYRFANEEGMKFNGFTVGVSIPLFSNRKQVKIARSQAVFTDLRMDNTKSRLLQEFRSNYNEALALKTSQEEYVEVLGEQNNLSLLTKALKAGNISLVDFFVDATQIYEVMDTRINLENQYQKQMARLLRFEL